MITIIITIARGGNVGKRYMRRIVHTSLSIFNQILIIRIVKKILLSEVYFLE